MKQTICICLFAAGLTIVGIIGVIGIKNDYRQPPEEDLTYAVETEKITETEIPELAESMAIPKDYAYVIFARDGVLVVYEKDCETEYFEGDMVSYNGIIYNCIYYNESNPDEGIVGEINNPNSFEVVEGYDLTFLFEGTLSNNRKAIIYPYYGSENQLQAQYPSEEIIARCAIMNDFGEYNDNVVIMWGQVKAYTNMVPVYIFLITFIVFVGLFFIIFAIKSHINNRYKKIQIK